jgi:hypothetical protein
MKETFSPATTPRIVVPQPITAEDYQAIVFQIGEAQAYRARRHQAYYGTRRGMNSRPPFPIPSATPAHQPR